MKYVDSSGTEGKLDRTTTNEVSKRAAAYLHPEEDLD